LHFHRFGGLPGDLLVWNGGYDFVENFASCLGHGLRKSVVFKGFEQCRDCCSFCMSGDIAKYNDMDADDSGEDTDVTKSRLGQIWLLQIM